MNRRSFITKTSAGLLCAALCPSILYATNASQSPNLIMILIDDMGWKDTGFAGSQIVDTPNLDKLARSGMIFNQAYAAAPNCAPTRACLMTGLYTPRHGVYTVVDNNHQPGLPHHKVMASSSRAELGSDFVTIAEEVKGKGYATGMIGMWNLGRGRRGPHTPLGQGFDLFKEPKTLGFEKDAYKNENNEYLTHKMTEAGIDFIRSNHNKPFFLYLSYHAVHAPFDPEKDLLEKYEQRVKGSNQNPALAATIESLDTSIGNLIKALEDQGIKENTYLIFTSDNGGTHHNTAPLREGKGSLYEGGIRVPAFIAGPGIQSGQISEMPISSIDFFPTFLELAGGGPINVDGKSLVPLITKAQSLNRDELFWHFPCYIGRGKPSSAMRYKNFKLIEFFETGSIELYNLDDDPGESDNLVKKQPDLADKLYNKLKQWQIASHAPLPTLPNPNYNPEARPVKNRNNRGKGRIKKERGNEKT